MGRRRSHGHPVRQAPPRDRRHDHQRRERRAGEELGRRRFVDYKNHDFETILHDYDLVLDPVGGENVEKSMRVLKPCGLVVGIGGPPDPQFAKEMRGQLVRRVGDEVPEPQSAVECPAPRGALRVPVHESKW